MIGTCTFQDVWPVKGRLVSRWLWVTVFLLMVSPAQAEKPLAPLVRVVDMDVGEEQQIELHDGSLATVQLLDVESTTDDVMGAVRKVDVTLRVNGKKVTVQSGNYNLPVTAAGVQLDVPVTHNYMKLATQDSWGLKKDARLRLWPEGSPYIWPGTFVYPVNQKWMASMTWFSNEPVHVPRPNGNIYYHSGLDFGGAEGLTEVYAATDGIVVSAGGEALAGEPQPPISPRYDVIYIRDARGWYYRYSHLYEITENLEVGQRVQAGQQIGVLGKEGASGGWAHLHFEIKSREPSGEWGTQDGYAFLWEAYRQQYNPKVAAVARPHKVVRVGEVARLSAGHSWAKNGIQSYQWKLSDGSSAAGKTVKRTYDQPGTYSEVVKVTDGKGNYDYDYAVVKVFGKGNDGQNEPPGIYAVHYPTFGIEPGEKVTFKVRVRGTTGGYDIWDFDDETPTVKVQSDINAAPHAKVGYSTTTHRFKKPGDYLVQVQRKNKEGSATAYVHVKVTPQTDAN